MNETKKQPDGSVIKSSNLLDKISACPWDDGDWIIAFGNTPIGCCMSMNEAQAIARWIKNNGASLYRYMSNDTE